MQERAVRIRAETESVLVKPKIPTQETCTFCLLPATVRISGDPACAKHAPKILVQVLALSINLAKGV